MNDEIKVESDTNAAVVNTEENGKPHSDKWIALKVKSELLVHANVSATHTDVNVVGGVVTLSGTAKNKAQRELTEQYAKGVDGVREVHNEIQIRDDSAAVASADTAPSSTFAGDSRYTAGERIDDTSITAKVKLQLAKDSSTSAMKTEVHTQNGVVYLSGNADNAAQKDLVTKLAQNVPGVASVNNNMTVVNP